MEASAEAKFLGIWIDRKLRFRRQVEYALRKGTAWYLQFGRLARPKRGIRMRHVRTLYEQMLLPGMLYAASVWIVPQRTIPGRRNTYGSVGIIRKLGRIHRQVCTMITGALRSTPTDSMEAHLDLPPFHLLVDRMIIREASRLCTLPPTHPLYAHVKRAAKWVKRHRSPLHEILAAYDLRPTEIETIAATRYPPGWRAPCAVSISATKDDTANDEQKWVEKDGWRVYSDGSDVDGGVGAAAVLTAPGRNPKVLRYYLGTSTDHSVYEGEVIGIALGIELLHRERTCRTASCAVDNTASLRAVQNRKPHPAHYLVDELLKRIEALQRRHPGIDLTLRWVPGHKGIDGNEQADKEAKKAARGDSSPVHSLPAWL